MTMSQFHKDYILSNIHCLFKLHKIHIFRIMQKNGFEPISCSDGYRINLDSCHSSCINEIYVYMTDIISTY